MNVINKAISVEEAANLLNDGATMSSEGFTTTLFPEYIADEIIKRFVDTGHPKNISIFVSGGKGDGGKTDLGLNKFALDGLVKKITISHMGTNRKIEEMAHANKIEAYYITPRESPANYLERGRAAIRGSLRKSASVLSSIRE